MTWWIVDNFVLVLAFLLPVTIVLGLIWWTSQNSKYLIATAASTGLTLICVLLWLFVITDRRQLVRDVERMAELFNAGKTDEFLMHVHDVVTIKTDRGDFVFKRDQLPGVAKSNAASYGVSKVVVNMIKVREVSRPNAEVTFFVGPDDGTARGLCRMGFVYSNDGKWRVATCGVETPGTGQKTQLLFPFAR